MPTTLIEAKPIILGVCWIFVQAEFARMSFV
jgi:hypothetical protein